MGIFPRIGRSPGGEMNSWEYSMWAYIRHPDGSTEEREFPTGISIEIGDILEDGAVVIDLPYPDDYDDDMDSLLSYDE